MFTLSHVKKSFGDNPVLRDVSIKVNDGDVVAVLGPSGSGKTTLLRAASYLTRADGGTVELDGEIFPLNKISRRDLLRYRRKTGFVFQNFNLFPHYSVLRNITEAPRLILKKSRTEAEKTAMELLKKVGLADKAKAYPCELSGGQQQRVAIVRALAMSPSILFFDEPTSALDPELTGEILEVIRLLAEDHMTMVIVTHEMSFARAISNHPKILLADEPTGALDSKSGAQIMELFQSLHEEGVTIIMITHDMNLAKEANRIITLEDGHIVKDEKIK